MKIIATLKGAIRKYVGMEVLVTRMPGKAGDDCPVKPQICRILENDCIGFMVTNEGRDLMTVEKGSQDVAVISVWCNSDLQQHDLERRF